MKKLSQKIVRLLGKKRLKISFAESCTGGLLSSTITSISGSSKVFTIGLVAYSNQSKISALKVPKKTIRKVAKENEQGEGFICTRSQNRKMYLLYVEESAGIR